MVDLVNLGIQELTEMSLKEVEVNLWIVSLPVESPVTIEKEYFLHHHYDAQLEE